MENLCGRKPVWFCRLNTCVVSKFFLNLCGFCTGRSRRPGRSGARSVLSTCDFPFAMLSKVVQETEGCSVSDERSGTGI